MEKQIIKCGYKYPDYCSYWNGKTCMNRLFCKSQNLQGTAPNTEGRTSTPETTDKPDHEAQ